jgi:hypothetical protein
MHRDFACTILDTIRLSYERAVGTLLVFFASGAAYGQAADTGPEFEVASIKPSAPIGYAQPMWVMTNGGPGTPDPGRFTTQNLRLNNIVTLAYGIERYQITTPEWMQSTRFDISAKVPEGTTKEQFRMMLQRLLAERFKLAVHHEQKEMRAYKLTVGKNGPKFKESADEPALASNSSARFMIMNGRVVWRVTQMPIDAFALRLAGPTIYSAIQEQFGLKLTPKKVAVDILVVDHMEKAPTEN